MLKNEITWEAIELYREATKQWGKLEVRPSPKVAQQHISRAVAHELGEQ